jgi:hypothetical protein
MEADRFVASRERLRRNIATMTPGDGIVGPNGAPVKSEAAAEPPPDRTPRQSEAATAPAKPAQQLLVTEISVLVKCQDGGWRRAYLNDGTGNVILHVLKQQIDGVVLTPDTVKLKREWRVVRRLRNAIARFVAGRGPAVE